LINRVEGEFVSGPDQDAFYQIANEIISELGPILGTRPYLGIVRFDGEFIYIEPALDPYKDFISSFSRSNFDLLKLGDHSMPISGTNLAFFKVCNKAIIVIFIKKGLIGQLLIFKARMMKYQEKLDALIPEQPTPTQASISITPSEAPEILKQAPAPTKAQIIPLLLKEIGKKDKFPLQEVVILNYCNGKNSIEDIMREGNLDRKGTWDILDKYTKKGWVKITYTGHPLYVPVLSKEIPPMAVQLGVVNKKEFEISKLCDGKHTVESIQKALNLPREELNDAIEKMVKNGIIHLEIQ
jgi:predicted transcriptional regulator